MILADVGRSAEDPAKFVLRRVGIGLCVPDPPKGDVVVHSSRLEELGVRLGMVEKIVLRSAEAELAKGRLIAAGPAFALYRGPTMMQVGQVHQKVELSYALLVDEQNWGIAGACLVSGGHEGRSGGAGEAGGADTKPRL